MTEHAVVIAGGGPTGLMLAAELSLAGVDVAVVERRATQELVGSRAGGLSARSLEVFDQRGIVDRFLAEGQVFQVTGFGTNRIDISDFPTRHNYGLGLWQNHIERIMAAWVSELPVRFYRTREVTGFTQDELGVDVQLSDGGMLRAEYLVGCDGGRSTVRKTAGIEFPGWDASTSNIFGEMDVTTDPPLGVHHTKFGTHAFGKEKYEIVDGRIVYGEGGPWRVMVTEAQPGATTEPTIEDIRARLIEICGTDYGIHSPAWISRFTDATRQAANYRKGRVLLAGDAAHIHSPIGGQGLGFGVQDAVNLGWKLAQVVKRISSDALLDTYHAERHPVGARMLKATMAQVALHRNDDRTLALRDILGDLMKLDEPRRTIGAEMSGLGVRYDLGEGHPLLGRRMPDLEVVTAEGPRRVFTWLHRARAVLINLRAPGSVAIGAWAGRVQLVDASYEGAWELPGLGAVPAPAAVLVRPDGHVAWVGDGSQTGLVEALTTWFGPATRT